MSTWLRLFPDEDFRFRMALRKGDTAAFFAPTADDSLLQQRRTQLESDPHRYAAALPDSLPMVADAMALLKAASGTAVPAGEDPLARCIAAGKVIEPDWVILSPDPAKNHPVMGGVVCFPSSWSLPEKLGLALHDVHRPAPTVTASLGGSIDAFLTRLRPGEAWLRENWGLSADAELDHHPDCPQSVLSKDARLTTTWLRLESQLLTRLPATSAILFGIRVTIHRLDTLAAELGLAPRIARALQTMPDDTADYKGLADCRTALISELVAR
ncbi:MAG: DUF3445 domain-containing protein [Verrucomicrobiales bacterium]|nr:DUF3445 domain-containing protein [Verrucomicrobiales bacterium]MCP5558884.1 DUF3445 domain-containing protein [Verrucomicrobiaceae bacterium]